MEGDEREYLKYLINFTEEAGGTLTTLPKLEIFKIYATMRNPYNMTEIMNAIPNIRELTLAGDFRIENIRVSLSLSSFP